MTLVTKPGLDSHIALLQQQQLSVGRYIFNQGGPKNQSHTTERSTECSCHDQTVHYLIRPKQLHSRSTHGCKAWDSRPLTLPLRHALLQISARELGELSGYNTKQHCNSAECATTVLLMLSGPAPRRTSRACSWGAAWSGCQPASCLWAGRRRTRLLAPRARAQSGERCRCALCGLTGWGS
jgi:hypothetical protein